MADQRTDGQNNICTEYMKCQSCFESEYLDVSGCCMAHCPVGLMVSKLFRERANKDKLTVDFIHKTYKQYDTHFVEYHGLPPTTVTHEGNGVYQGAFAFTLTKSPSDDLTEEDMVIAVKKVMTQKSIPVKKFAWYVEYGDDELKTHPHIHGMYETVGGGRIETKHWKRAWPIWDPKVQQGSGFRGGYHRPVRDTEGYSDYIKKDGGLSDFVE